MLQRLRGDLAGALLVLVLASGCSLNSTSDTMQENRRLIENRYEAVNAHDFDRFQRFYADSIVWDDPGLAEPVRGPATVGARLKTWVAAFPDLRWNLDRLFGQDDWVCAEFTFTGTHKGPLENPSGVTIPASDRSIRIQAVGVYRMDKDKIVESRIYFDFTKIQPPIAGQAK